MTPFVTKRYKWIFVSVNKICYILCVKKKGLTKKQISYLLMQLT